MGVTVLFIVCYIFFEIFKSCPYSFNNKCSEGAVFSTDGFLYLFYNIIWKSDTFVCCGWYGWNSKFLQNNHLATLLYINKYL